MCYCNCKYENNWGECTIIKKPYDAQCMIWEREIENCHGCRYFGDPDNCAMWDFDDGMPCPGKEEL